MTINMKTAAIALAVSTALGVCGLRSNWGPFTLHYGPESTAYVVKGTRAVKHNVNGKRVCVYMDDVAVDADDGLCPNIVIRHLATVSISYDGKCHTVCGYDNNLMYSGELKVYDRKSCPDILVTVAGGGRIDVLSTKYLDFGDRAWMYYDTTKTFEWSLEDDDRLISRCMDDKYRKQLDFYDMWADREAK